MFDSVIITPKLEAMLEVARGSPPGAFVEVGVYRGGSAKPLTDIAIKQNRKIFLYDTFEGIPYTNKSKGDFHQVGDFKDTNYDKIKEGLPYATVIKGLFPDSAVEMGPVAFCHIDCDQYQSVFDTVTYLRPLVVKGGIMYFDDAPDLEGAMNAVIDLFGRDNYTITPENKIIKVLT